MGAEPGPFEAFYASSVQHPILLWIAAGAAFAWAVTRPGLPPSVRRYCAVLTALSWTDAWLTGNHVYGVGVLPGWLARAVPLCFVLAGDYRFLLLLEAATPGGGVEPSAGRLLRAAGLTVLVPLLVLGASPDSPRVLFLVYETAFLLLTVALMRWHPGARSVAWLRPVIRCVLLYYGLWAGADAILLATGSDLGFLLRVVPNVLYYGGLVAVIGHAAARASGTRLRY